MSQDFDPYFKWLKIPPSEQPPNHYRLLNTARFESDPEIIENAVARLVTLLQNVSTGDQAEYAQRILNDVAKARLCLSDPQRKAEYDERLRKELSGVASQPPKRIVASGTRSAKKNRRRETGTGKVPASRQASGSGKKGKARKRKTGGKKKSTAKSIQKPVKQLNGHDHRLRGCDTACGVPGFIFPVPESRQQQC